MDSPVGSAAELHRKPLHPINSFPGPNSAVIGPKPKPIPKPIHFSTVTKADLVKEKIKLEKEKTEEMLKEKETRLETYTKEMEKRDEELKRLEMEMQMLIKRHDPRISSSSSRLKKYIKVFDRWLSMSSSIAKIGMCFKS